MQYNNKKDKDKLAKAALKAVGLDHRIEYFPNQPNLWFLNGVAYLSSTKNEQAIASLEQGKKMVFNNPELLSQFESQLGDIYYKNEDYKKADEAYEKALKQNPNNALLRNLLGDFYTNTNKFESAKPHYELLLKLKDYPIKAYIYNNLSNIAIETNIVEAEEYILKALELDNNSASILDTQGWIMSKQAKYEAALTVLRRAFSIDSEDPAIRYHLAFTLHKLGRNDEARRELLIAVASEKKFRERDMAQQLLKSI